MVTMKNMLFPTDLSKYSKAILNYVSDFSRIGVESVDLLYVVNLTKISNVAGGIDIEKYIEEESKKADEGLPVIAEVFERAGIRARIIKPYPTGDPVAEILNYSENYDFISMGSHGYGVIKEILLGSVSEGVVRHSKVPVFVFKFKVERNGEIVRCIKCHVNLFDRILVAYDFSKHSAKALEYAKYVAKKVGSELYLVHASEQECKDHNIDAIAKELADEGLNVKSYQMPGTPHKVIMKVIDEVDATAVFMGSRGLGAVKSLLLGSTSDAIIRRAPVPVFVCREVENED